MRFIFLAIGLFLSVTTYASSIVQDSLRFFHQIARTYPDSAYQIGERVVQRAKNNNDHFVMAKGYFLLGYIDKKRGVYDRATIHYLEALRYAKEASYESVETDRIMLHYNLGNIFRIFKAYELSEEYHQNAINLAKSYDDRDQLIVAASNLSNLYIDQEKYEECVEMIHEVLAICGESHDQYFKLLNSLGISLKGLGQYDEAIATFNRLLMQCPSDNHKLRGKAFHNIAVNYEEMGDYEKAKRNYLRAINEKQQVSNTYERLFISYKDLGVLYLLSQELDSAIHFLSLAELLIPHVQQNVECYSVYSLLADVHKMKNEDHISINYHKLYQNGLKDYLTLETEIKSKQEKYNMTMITQRYFDTLQAQADKRQLQRYLIWTTVAALLAIGAVVGGYKYKAYRLRTDIEEELIALKIIEE